MISMQEFLKYTEGPHFEDKNWEGLDNGDDVFSDQEFDDYMQDYGNDDYGKAVGAANWFGVNLIVVG